MRHPSPLYHHLHCPDFQAQYYTVVQAANLRRLYPQHSATLLPSPSEESPGHQRVGLRRQKRERALRGMHLSTWAMKGASVQVHVMFVGEHVLTARACVKHDSCFCQRFGSYCQGSQALEVGLVRHTAQGGIWASNASGVGEDEEDRLWAKTPGGTATNNPKKSRVRILNKLEIVAPLMEEEIEEQVLSFRLVPESTGGTWKAVSMPSTFRHIISIFLELGDPYLITMGLRVLYSTVSCPIVV